MSQVMRDAGRQINKSTFLWKSWAAACKGVRWQMRLTSVWKLLCSLSRWGHNEVQLRIIWVFLRCGSDVPPLSDSCCDTAALLLHKCLVFAYLSISDYFAALFLGLIAITINRITSAFYFPVQTWSAHKVCTVLARECRGRCVEHRMVVDDCDSAGSWNVTALMKVLPFGRVCVWSRPAGRANWQICFCDHVNELLPVTVWEPFLFKGCAVFTLLSRFASHKHTECWQTDVFFLPFLFACLWQSVIQMCSLTWVCQRFAYWAKKKKKKKRSTGVVKTQLEGNEMIQWADRDSREYDCRDVHKLH